MKSSLWTDIDFAPTSGGSIVEISDMTVCNRLQNKIANDCNFVSTQCPAILLSVVGSCGRATMLRHGAGAMPANRELTAF